MIHYGLFIIDPVFLNEASFLNHFCINNHQGTKQSNIKNNNLKIHFH